MNLLKTLFKKIKEFFEPIGEWFSSIDEDDVFFIIFLGGISTVLLGVFIICAVQAISIDSSDEELNRIEQEQTSTIERLQRDNSEVCLRVCKDESVIDRDLDEHVSETYCSKDPNKMLKFVDQDEECPICGRFIKIISINSVKKYIDHYSSMTNSVKRHKHERD